MHADTNDLSKIIKIVFAVTYLPNRKFFQDGAISRHTAVTFLSMKFTLPLNVPSQQTVVIPLSLWVLHSNSWICNYFRLQASLLYPIKQSATRQKPTANNCTMQMTESTNIYFSVCVCVCARVRVCVCACVCARVCSWPSNISIFTEYNVSQTVQ
jgi:hypothetical protein